MWYTSVDVRSPRKSPRPSRRSIPASKVEVERSGAERVFQRINQEYGSNIHNVDVVETSDAVHFVVFKAKAG